MLDVLLSNRLARLKPAALTSSDTPIKCCYGEGCSTPASGTGIYLGFVNLIVRAQSFQTFAQKVLLTVVFYMMFSRSLHTAVPQFTLAKGPWYIHSLEQRPGIPPPASDGFDHPRGNTRAPWLVYQIFCCVPSRRSIFSPSSGGVGVATAVVPALLLGVGETSLTIAGCLARAPAWRYCRC